MNLLVFALASLSRRAGKAVALGVGLALTVTLVAAVIFLTDALRAESQRAERALPDVVVQRLVGGRPTIIETSEVQKLQGIDGVSEVRARVWGYLFLPAIQGNVTIVGVPDAARPLDDARAVLGEGRDLTRGAHEMLVGDTLAHALGLAVGDTLGLPTSKPSPALRVAGTFRSDLDLYAADVLLCDDSDARALLGLAPNEATDIAVFVRNPAERRIVSETILARMPGARVIDKDALGRVYNLAYGRRGGLVLAASIPALIALIVLAWDRASGISPEEKREIAILKAVGFSTSDVLWARMFESLAVAVIASAVGLVAAYAWVFWAGAPGLRPALVGWSVLYPEAKLTPEVDFTQLLGISLSVVAPFVGLSIVGAWRAATLDPMDAMRG
jgi:lipoprotein-releasing system permease protein